MWPILVTVTLGIAARQQPVEVYQSPREAWLAALEDCTKQPETLRPYLRYIRIGNLPRQERDSFLPTFSGHINHLSRQARIAKPVLVTESLLRINLRDYAIPSKAWEELQDPLFNVQVEATVTTEMQLWPGGVWPQDGVNYPAGSFRYPVKKKSAGGSSRQRAVAPWLDPQVAAQLITATQSQAPVVNGLWFLNQTATSAERKPNYYDFLEVKNQNDFNKLVGFNGDLAKGRELLEAVSRSGVTQQPRRITREAVVGGGLWRTSDSARATDKSNPLRVLDKNDLVFQASEEFAPLKNGLMAWGLFAADGTRQDFAPPEIAKDKTSPNNDGRVLVGISCIRCHTPNLGLNDIDGWARGLFGRNGIELNSPDYDKALELQQQYLRKLEPFLDRDRAIYADALLEATGWTAKEYATQYGKFFSLYEDASVDANWVARDFGISPVEFQAALKRYAAAPGPGLDPSIAVFLRFGGSLPIRQYEESIPVLWAAYLAGRGKP